MVDLKYSLVIEKTSDPKFFGFYSPDLTGFTGTGRSIEDCVCRAKEGMEEFITFLREEGFAVPPESESPQIVIQDRV